jgi:hypothetical protein
LPTTKDLAAAFREQSELWDAMPESNLDQEAAGIYYQIRIASMALRDGMKEPDKTKVNTVYKESSGAPGNMVGELREEWKDKK